MNSIIEIVNELEKAHPTEWESIPDIDLYMDQVISYMPRQHIGLENGETLTSAMINNYMKSNLLPRARGKKYNREHIAYLTAICLLKQILSVGDTGILVSQCTSQVGIEGFYNEYAETVSHEFLKTAETLDPAVTPETETGRNALCRKALQLAVSSYADRLACEQIIGMLKEEK